MDSLELKVYYPIVSAWEVGLKVKHTGKALSVKTFVVLVFQRRSASTLRCKSVSHCTVVVYDQ